MSVLAIQTPTEIHSATSGARDGQRMAVFRSVLMLGIALGLVVPESEIRAKAFKINLIVKNMQRHAH